MPAIEVSGPLWSRFANLAREQRQSPSKLLQRALSEFLERETDEDLLNRTAAAARRAPFRIGETEREVRRRRRARRAT